jgi:transposase
MEILNLEYHHKIMSVKALNKVRDKKKAAELLGVSIHKLTTWVDRFNISYKNSKYLIERHESNN